MDAQETLRRNPHLAAYLQGLAQRGLPPPALVERVPRELRDQPAVDVLYPVGDPHFVHASKAPGRLPTYHVVEPPLGPELLPAYKAVKRAIYLLAPGAPEPLDLGALFDQAVRVSEDARAPLPGPLARLARSARRLELRPHEARLLRHHLLRDVEQYGPLTAIMLDPHIEDVHGLGLRPVHVVHRVFGMMTSNVRWPSQLDLRDFLVGLGERMGRPTSESRPIVDGGLPNGSRINIVSSGDVSKGGGSFTVRKFPETPISVTQLIAWRTLSAPLAAYLWLCLEHGMSAFVSGETASGKTTTLNALLPFVKAASKVITLEDTPEVLPPHENWQQLLTRDQGSKPGSVTMFDLLRASLRSRPDLIVLGEIRGAEGNVAFQAMQTGHATMATFHASSVGKLIQRFTSPPIAVPVSFMGNLNVVLVQQAVYVGGRMLRRVLEVEEIEGFSRRTKGVVTRRVFTWNPTPDAHDFAGRNNSFVLEELVAPRMGLEDPRLVYRELDRRARVLQDLVDRKVFDYRVVAPLLQGGAEHRAEAAQAVPA